MDAKVQYNMIPFATVPDVNYLGRYSVTKTSVPVTVVQRKTERPFFSNRFLSIFRITRSGEMKNGMVLQSHDWPVTRFPYVVAMLTASLRSRVHCSDQTTLDGPPHVFQPVCQMPHDSGALGKRI